MNPDVAAGVYIHFPWCIRKCGYCDFNSRRLDDSTKNEISAYPEIVTQEIEKRLKGFIPSRFDSIYFGGGTPSLCSPKTIRNLVEYIGSNAVLSEDIEITLEANPGTIDAEKLRLFLNAKVNRLSIGVQSLSDRELETLGRVHGANDARKAIGHAIAAGFKNIGADLMYGIPGQTEDTFVGSIRGVVEAGVDHVSAYALTLSAGTPMSVMVADGKIDLPPEDLVAGMYQSLCEVLAGYGFNHYEISNWARPGHECRHNIDCWKGRFYMGVGAGAHGYQPGGSGRFGVRYSNVKEPANYAGMVENRLLPEDFREELSSDEKASELIYLGLRTAFGAKLKQIEELFDEKRLKSFYAEVDVLVKEGLAMKTDDILKLTDGGMLYADAIALRLI